MLIFSYSLSGDSMLRKIVDYIKEEEFRMTVFQDRIHLMNYSEVLSLEENRISVQYPSGRIVIKGENLMVNRLLDKEILITGKVIEIEMSGQ